MSKRMKLFSLPSVLSTGFGSGVSLIETLDRIDLEADLPSPLRNPPGLPSLPGEVGREFKLLGDPGVGEECALWHGR